MPPSSTSPSIRRPRLEGIDPGSARVRDGAATRPPRAGFEPWPVPGRGPRGHPPRRRVPSDRSRGGRSLFVNRRPLLAIALLAGLPCGAASGAPVPQTQGDDPAAVAVRPSPQALASLVDQTLAAE